MTQPISKTQFSSLNLHPALVDAIEQTKWKYCTPIQEQTLPLTLNGHDIAGKAQTGTGKTAAFLIAVLNYLMTNPVQPNTKGPWSLILAPTRELAQQIYNDTLVLGCYTGLKPTVIYGGKNYEQQKRDIQSQMPDIIIGTPGRVIDLFKQRFFSLDNIEALVLDEADRMLDLGFISDIRFLLRRMPKAQKRLNLIFSATFNYSVEELIYEHFNAPKLIEIASKKETAEKVSQALYHVANDEKAPLIKQLVSQLDKQLDKAIVFVNMKRDLDHLFNYLKKSDIPITALSGDIPQDKREKMLAQFKSGKKHILLATDVAARGIHIDDITHVFNYDLPQNPEDYIHRIGRTARAGKSGQAISFCCENYAYHLPDIEEKIGEKIPLKNVTDIILSDK